MGIAAWNQIVQCSRHLPGFRYLLGSGLAALVVGLGVGATLARLAGLDHLLIWHDEVFTLIRVFGYPHDLVQQTLFSDRLLTPADLLRFQLPDPDRTWGDTLRALAEHPEHAPLYYLLARLATELPLEPVTAVRGTAAVFGILLVPAGFWFMRELFGRGPGPWVAAALIACSPVQLLFAQEARQYSLWLAAILLASLALVRALRSGRTGDWWLYGCGVSLGLYAHLLFVALLPVHAAYLLLNSRRRAEPRATLGRDVRRWGMAVGAAMLSFLPWIWVIVSQPGRVAYYTSWMGQGVGIHETLLAWARHLIEAFIDLKPEPEWIWSIALLPLGWTLLRFVRHAPRPMSWLLPITALAYMAVTLGPDLLEGGSRSLQARYALPVILAVQLMVGWVIGDALGEDRRAGSRRAAAVALFILLAAGGLSQLAIGRAETWSTKNFSSQNAAVARIANASDDSLILASDPSGIGPGELISLAYHLRPDARILGQSWHRPLVVPAKHGKVILLSPTDSALAALGSTDTAMPIPGTWQWFVAVDPARHGLLPRHP